MVQLEELKRVIKDVGEENMDQLVISKGLAFVKVGKLLMKKFNIY